MKTVLMSLPSEMAGLLDDDPRDYDIVISENKEVAIPLAVLPQHPNMTFLAMMADGEPMISVAGRPFARTAWVKKEWPEDTNLMEYVATTERSVEHTKIDWDEVND